MSDDNTEKSMETKSPADRSNPRERGNGQGESHGGGGTGRRKVLTAQGAIRQAVGHAERLTGRSPESITGLEPDGNYGWHVTVEIVEPARTRGSTAIPVQYSVHLSDKGRLVSYQRENRYVPDRTVEAPDKDLAVELGLNADLAIDIAVSVAGFDLLGVRLRGALAPRNQNASERD